MSPWKNSLTALVLLGMALAVTSGSQDAAAAVRTWTGTSDNVWLNSLNWNPNGVPADLDDLIVNSGTPVATSDVTTDSGGSITVDGAGTSATFDQYLYVGDTSIGTLNVTGGGSIENDYGYIGQQIGSTGTVTVDGTDSTWTNNELLIIGLGGSGTLAISDGGGVESKYNTYLGENNNSAGTVTVDGDGSTWANTAAIVVGSHGTGTLEIIGGGSVSTNYGYIGFHSDSLNSTVTVEGTDTGGTTPSTWTIISDLYVGRASPGTLEILSGGSVSNTSGYIGYLSGANGTVTVSGTDSTWTNTTGLYVGGSNAAAGGTGSLTVQTGGTVDVTSTLKVWTTGHVYLEDGQINTHDFVVAPGTFTHNSGTLDVSGAFNPGTTAYAIDGVGNPTIQLTGGSVALTNILRIGNTGTGTLNITDGGSVSNTIGHIGSAANSVGTVTVSGNGSTWTNTSSLLVGYYGTGTLNISSGGSVSNTIGHIGSEANSVGTATVSGTDSTWTNTSSLIVGYYGDGTLNISGGGSVSNTIGHIGSEANSIGGVAVSGAGSTWTNLAELQVGLSGTGTLEISDGAGVSNTYGRIGFSGNSMGMVTVAGAGSTWTNTSDLRVGFQGTGTLDISSGGSVSNTIGHIGSEANSAGGVTVSGAGSTWTNTSDLLVGYYGTGTLDISSGGSVSNAVGTIGYYAMLESTVTVDGVGSTWTNDGELYIGRDGTGKLDITGGGSVSNNSSGYIGYTNTSYGTVNVDGAGSTWSNNGELFVGRGSYGRLVISGGGSVSNNNNNGKIGYAAGSRGSVEVSGAGSTWTNTSNLSVGVSGIGTLDISDGGSVSSGYAYIGELAGSDGTVTVDGAGSTWTNNGQLDVGRYGSGALEITGGGSVSCNSGSIGFLAGSDGTVTVEGSGSTWDNSSLYVGGSQTAAGGTGVLTVKTGATVNAGALLKIWSAGTVNLNGGTLQAGTFDLVGGDLNFNYGTLHDTSDLTVELGDDLETILGGSHTVGFAKHLKVSGTTTLDDVLTIDGGTFSTGSLVNPGLMQFTSGTFNLTTDDLTIGSTGLLGSTLALPNTKTVGVTNQTTIESGGQLVLQGGTFSSGSLRNEGAIGGSGQINAPLENASTGVVRAFTGEHQTISGAGHVNDGQIQLFGGGLEFVGDLTNNSGGTIMGNGTLIAQGGTTNTGTMAFSATSNVGGDLTNQAGGLVISAGGTASFFEDVVNEGEIRTSQGSFTVFFGSLSGSGSYTGPGTVLIEGDLLPGSSPAVVGFAGDLAFGDAATLVMELYGTDPSEFDAIDVADTLSLAGTLDVRLMDAFAPSVDDAFEIIEWSALDGSFDEMLLPVLEGYLAWDTNDLYVTGEIAVIGSLHGDANVDGTVNVSDLGILATNYGQGGGLGWGKGDFNGDGIVDVSDLGVLATNYGTTAAIAAQSVPEPGMLALLATCGLTLLGLGARRRKQ